ncbi:MAG TPA: hypothetical protein VG890_10360 [Puia sp.]|nr:hypothetical protein [Puia sp.]
MKTLAYGCLPFLLLLGSCAIEQNYLMSPMDINSHPYAPLPMASDSLKAMTYGGLAFNIGSSNEGQRDRVAGVSVSVGRSHQFGNFQAYYSGNFNFGGYYFDVVETTYGYEKPARSYGGFGFNGGLNAVIPFGHGRGEWRFLGVETGYQQEFGQFFNYRKNLPDSLFDVNAVYRHAFRIGGSTEIIGKTRHGTIIGYRFSAGVILYPPGTYIEHPGSYSDPTDLGNPFYAAHCLSFTRDRVTGYVQANIGVNAGGVQFGFIYRLSPKSKR